MHHCYCFDMGQILSTWYDWEIFEINDKMVPYQLFCFLDIQSLKDDTHLIGKRKISTNSQYNVA